MKKKIEKGSEEWKVFTRTWEFFQDYAIPEDDDKYWDDVVNFVGEMEREYKTPLAKWLAYGVSKALAEIMKGET